MLETVESLLIGLFRFIGWRRGLALAPPVTPEVAGSSPVAPALECPAQPLFAACGWATGFGSVNE